MPRLLPCCLLAFALPGLVFATPALAESPTAGSFVSELLQQQLLSPSDKVWLAPQSSDRSAKDIAVLDSVSAVLTTRGVAAMWDVGLTSSPAAGSFPELLASLKGMGVTKLLSFSRADDLGNITVRVIEVPSGWIKRVQVVRIDAAGGISEPKAIAITPTVVVPIEGAFQWSPSHGMGLQYSWLSGSGVAYRRWFENGWGFQVAGIPALASSNNAMNGLVNLGTQGMVTFLKTDRLRLYGLLGVGALYRANDVRYGPYDPVSGTSSSRTGDAWDTGIAPGAGLDFRIFDRFVLTGAIGYTFSRQKFSTDEPTYGYSPGVTTGVMIEW